MAQIYETENFIVESHEHPFVSRTDGGHIRICIKDSSIPDRTQLTPKAAIELMRLTMIVGEAMEKGLNQRGIKVVKINYQDMGNWAFKTGDTPFLHVHVFGRTFDAKYQIFPESVYLPARESGFYDTFEPLNAEDIIEIQKQIEIVSAQKKYQLQQWEK
ncbi:MAG: HIT domain-containing protein [Candidatus Peribacteria bacterium]|nr:MAG: HIT domain-containing protein [Candidatus Peribacteria bacterium]